MADGESRIFELKVGIFIAVGILIFFIIVFSIGDVYLIKKGYGIKITFNFVNGLNESAPVRLAGVNVGRVDKIDLYFDENEKKTKVKVLAWIEGDDVKIEKDSRPVVNTLGLLGEKYLEIFPGTDTVFLKNNDEIIGHDPVSTERITEELGELVSSASVVMERLKNGEGTVGKFLVDEKVYDNVEAFTEDIKNHPWKLLHKSRE